MACSVLIRMALAGSFSLATTVPMAVATDGIPAFREYSRPVVFYDDAGEQTELESGAPDLVALRSLRVSKAQEGMLGKETLLDLAYDQGGWLSRQSETPIAPAMDGHEGGGNRRRGEDNRFWLVESLSLPGLGSAKSNVAYSAMTVSDQSDESGWGWLADEVTGMPQSPEEPLEEDRDLSLTLESMPSQSEPFATDREERRTETASLLREDLGVRSGAVDSPSFSQRLLEPSLSFSRGADSGGELFADLGSSSISESPSTLSEMRFTGRILGDASWDSPSTLSDAPSVEGMASVGGGGMGRPDGLFALDVLAPALSVPATGGIGFPGGASRASSLDSGQMGMAPRPDWRGGWNSGGNSRFSGASTASPLSPSGAYESRPSVSSMSRPLAPSATSPAWR